MTASKLTMKQAKKIPITLPYRKSSVFSLLKDSKVLKVMEIIDSHIVSENKSP